MSKGQRPEEMVCLVVSAFLVEEQTFLHMLVVSKVVL